MALYPNRFNGQFKLQPGARGEKFTTNQPGYRHDDAIINRTNIRLNHNEHDTPNVKYMFDHRLPALFRYGYAHGYNQIVIPKGRIVAVDPFMDLVDFDMQKKHSTLTIANGGAPVKPRETGENYKDYGSVADKLVSPAAQNTELANLDIEWMPLIGMTDAYTDYSYRPFRQDGPMKQLDDNNYEINKDTGLVVEKISKEVVDVIPGNVPIGILIRNEYTRDNDALNGMAPGAVNTDCMVELPWFAYKDKAEGNPWGSAYGGLFPGALVKPDENGRFVVSPLSFEQELQAMTVREYELERQQVVGQVYAVNTEMVPEGAAKWATWALSDRLNFEDFNPLEYPVTGRDGEDAVHNSPYDKKNFSHYPYERNYGMHDLHMLGGVRSNYDQRMNFEYQYENLGIPGLTDGYNAVSRDFGPIQVGTVRVTKNMTDSLELFFRLPEVKVEHMQIAIGSKQDLHFAPLVEGAKLSLRNNGANEERDAVEVKYADELQGLFVIKMDITKGNNFANAVLQGPQDTHIDLPVYVKFAKRGLSGVPTFMDWDGCVGSVKILLQK